MRPSSTAPQARSCRFTRLPDGDVYAPQAGFSAAFPRRATRSSDARGSPTATGCWARGATSTRTAAGGAELYVVIGHAPRHLDRNVTLLGRVVQGMELLSTLPRGPAPMGFYEKSRGRACRSGRSASPPTCRRSERTSLELFRTDTAAFAALVEARRNRREDWFKNKAGRIELCNVPLPVRPVGANP